MYAGRAGFTASFASKHGVSNGARGPGGWLAIQPSVKVNVGLSKVNHALDIDGVAVFKGSHGVSNGARGPGEGLVVVAVDWSVTDGVKLRQRGLWFSFGHLEPVPTIGHALVLPLV